MIDTDPMKSENATSPSLPTALESGIQPINAVPNKTIGPTHDRPRGGRCGRIGVLNRQSSRLPLAVEAILFSVEEEGNCTEYTVVQFLSITHRLSFHYVLN